MDTIISLNLAWKFILINLNILCIYIKLIYNVIELQHRFTTFNKDNDDKTMILKEKKIEISRSYN